MLNPTHHATVDLERIAMLLDRLDPGSPDTCTVPGCVHHHPRSASRAARAA